MSTTGLTVFYVFLTTILVFLLIETGTTGIIVQGNYLQVHRGEQLSKCMMLAYSSTELRVLRCQSRIEENYGHFALKLAVRFRILKMGI